MGCYPPLGKFVSKALGKCNGRERWREERLDYAMAYPPGPPMQTHYMRPVARTVTFASTNSVYVVPPEPMPPPPAQQQQSPPPPEHHPQHPQTPPQHEPNHHPDPPQPQPQHEPPEQSQDAPPPSEPKPPKGPKRGKKKKQPGRVRFGPEPPPPEEQQQQQPSEDNSGSAAGGQGQHGYGPPHGPEPAPAPAQGHLFRYTPSPLPRWEATPRRHEYFSGEYRGYYPTPVREGIYRIATDANRLTTIFSEENPNACTII